MLISLVVAASDNNVIGKGNALPWHLPDDMKHFRALTDGHVMIMGRKTFDSIGKALPNRKNIVITRQEIDPAAGCDVVHSLEEALALARSTGAEEAFIIGGGEIYAQALPLADRVYLTRVHTTIDGDAYFPAIDMHQWEKTEKHEHAPDPKHTFAFTFTLLERKK